MSADSNYVVKAVDSELRRTRTELRWKLEERVKLRIRIAKFDEEVMDLKVKEAQLVAFLAGGDP
jgi:hypothetical protein